MNWNGFLTYFFSLYVLTLFYFETKSQAFVENQVLINTLLRRMILIKNVCQSDNLNSLGVLTVDCIMRQLTVATVSQSQHDL